MNNTINCEWRDWFSRSVSEIGFKDSYTRLNSYVKFRNYHDNTMWWHDGCAIKYSEFEELSRELAFSCEIANEAINKMMQKELAQ